MARLRYDPWVLSLHLIDATAARWVTLSPDRLAQILAETRPVETIQTVRVQAVRANVGEMPSLVENGRMIALAGFSERILCSSGEGMLRQEVEEVLRAFTSIEFSLPQKLRNQLLPFQQFDSQTCENELAAWLKTIEYYARVKSTWRLPSEIVVRLPAGKLAIDVSDRLSRLGWRNAFQVQRGGELVGFTAEQQQAQYGMKLCEEPYRVITFGACGQLTGCSGDQRQRVYFGSLEEDTLRGLWEGAAMETWRRNRITGQCQGCPGLGSDLRQPSLISVYNSVGEQRFHEYPRQQLCKIANQAEGNVAPRMVTARDFFCAPRKVS
ncbi:hypothetical protein GC197_17495 [bacterium]|nr:hypothetical protein [bacterium]